MQIATIGHGARPLEDFLATLAAGGVEQVLDVRAYPGSRRYPWFGRERLTDALADAGVGYHWLPALGGRRKAGPTAQDHPGWRIEAFRNYAGYMDEPGFDQALSDLLALANERHAAVMCAETHPSQCHRRLIADRLTTLGHEVRHLISPMRVEAHALTPFLRREGEHWRYDAGAGTGQLDLR